MKTSGDYKVRLEQIFKSSGGDEFYFLLTLDEQPEFECLSATMKGMLFKLLVEADKS